MTLEAACHRVVSGVVVSESVRSVVSAALVVLPLAKGDGVVGGDSGRWSVPLRDPLWHKVRELSMHAERMVMHGAG